MDAPIVLDSFALVSLFHKDPGWKKIQQVLYELTPSGQKALLNIINWGEFYYIIPISYADAFCIATAKRHGGQIFTNDREFESVKQLVSVVWLTAP